MFLQLFLVAFGSIIFSALAISPTYANTITNPLLDAVVRVQGANPASGGTGTLLGTQQVGNLFSMLFLAADHTIERVGPVQTLGFGNLGSATALDLSTFTNLAVTTGGPTGAVDMAIIGATIDLNTLTQSQQSYLTGILPVALATSPTNPNFSIQGTGFGHDGVATTVYGTQNSFSNTITGFIQPFSGSYTTNANNQPLNYTEQIETWTYDSISGLGGCIQGCSGSPLFSNGSVQGIQVSGSIAPGGTNMGLSLTTEYINWIDTQKNAYFASAVPIPSAMWLMGSTLLGLIAFAKRREKC